MFQKTAPPQATPARASQSSNSPFYRLTDPTEFGANSKQARRAVMPLTEDTLEDVLNLPATEVLNDKMQVIKHVNLALTTMVNRHTGKVLRAIKRTPSREEVLVDLVRSTYPKYTPDQIQDLVQKDPESDPAVLQDLITKVRAQFTPVAEKTAAAPVSKTGKPSKKALPKPSPVEEVDDDAGGYEDDEFKPVPKTFKLPNAAPVVPPQPLITLRVKGPWGVSKIPVLGVTYEEEFVVVLQDTDNEFFWEPSHESMSLVLTEGEDSFKVQFSGISYTVNGVNHTVFIKEA